MDGSFYSHHDGRSNLTEPMDTQVIGVSIYYIVSLVLFCGSFLCGLPLNCVALRLLWNERASSAVPVTFPLNLTVLNILLTLTLPYYTYISYSAFSSSPFILYFVVIYMYIITNDMFTSCICLSKVFFVARPLGNFCIQNEKSMTILSGLIWVISIAICMVRVFIFYSHLYDYVLFLGCFVVIACSYIYIQVIYLKQYMDAVDTTDLRSALKFTLAMLASTTVSFAPLMGGTILLYIQTNVTVLLTYLCVLVPVSSVKCTLDALIFIIFTGGFPC